jgi:hypothetical protein
MPINFLLVPILIFCALSILPAQTVMDYIVTKDGDTLYGEIHRSVNLQHRVDFRTSDKSNFKAYKAEDIKAYQQGSDLYKSFELRLKEGGKESTFLLQLVSGSINLYAYSDVVFYAEKNGAFHILEKKDRIMDGKILDDRRFTGVLKVFFQDCGEWEERLSKVKFNEKDLSELVWSYNECKDPLLKRNYEVRESAKLSIRPRIAAGISYNRPKAKESPYQKYSGFSPGYCLVFGASIKPSQFSNFLLQPTVHFTKKKGSASGIYSFGDYEALFIQPLVKMTYSFPLKFITLDFSAGGVYSIGVDRQGSFAAISRNDRDIGLLAGGGLRLNAFETFQPLMEYQIEGGQFLSHKLILGVEF